MEQTRFGKAVSAAFTGHRSCQYSMRDCIKARLRDSITKAYEHGIRNYISGFAIGFDMLAAEVVVSMKVDFPDITLTAAIPFNGQSMRYSPTDKLRYERLMNQADEVIVLSESYYTRCYLERDEFMVDHSNLLIAYYDGREKGGTYYTVKKATNQGVRVVNLF